MTDRPRPGLVDLCDIRPGNGAGNSYNPGARTGHTVGLIHTLQHQYRGFWLSPNLTVCSTQRLLNSNNFLGSAAFAEVWALLSTILVVIWIFE